MASGDDKNQLPRGLIGRTGTPSGKAARLPSIRGPRDLTLGGVQKKVFTPTIPARRNKQEASTSADQTAAPNKDSKAKKNQPGGRDSGGRGRGRGRGQGRVSANVIQTHSLFEQGPTEKVHKPTGGSEYSYAGGGRGGGGSSSSPRKTFKKERTDEETKEVLEHLLRDDFISGQGFDEDVNLMPVKLPLEFKTDLDLKDGNGSKVKVKEEPMDVDNDSHGDDKDKVQLGKTMTVGKSKEQERISCSQLFTSQNKFDDGQLLYFQLPDILPGLPVTTDEEFQKKEKGSNEKDSEGSGKPDSRSLENFSEGVIGKLVVRKSGRVQLMLGNTYLDVNMGTPNGFLQDLACVRVGEGSGDISLLGHIDHRLVCTPDFETLLDNT